MNKNYPIFNPDDVERNRAMGAVCIFSILFIIYLFSAEKSPYMRYCANKGLFFTGVSLVLTFVLRIFSFLRYFSEDLVLLALIVYFILAIVLFLYRLSHIISAYKGDPRPLPIIGNITIIK